jgi:hypothetical protein
MHISLANRAGSARGAYRARIPLVSRGYTITGEEGLCGGILGGQNHQE